MAEDHASALRKLRDEHEQGRDVLDQVRILSKDIREQWPESVADMDALFQGKVDALGKQATIGPVPFPEKCEEGLQEIVERHAAHLITKENLDALGTEVKAYADEAQQAAWDRENLEKEVKLLGSRKEVLEAFLSLMKTLSSGGGA